MPQLNQRPKLTPTELKSKFIEQIAVEYPALSAAMTAPYVADQLLSPFVIRLPKKYLQQAQEFVAALFLERQNQEYVRRLEPELKDKQLELPGNYSILMSYDFHIGEDENLKLIEVNTNAAFLALGHSMYQTQNLNQPVPGFSISELKENILQEIHLNGKSSVKNPRVAIIDDRPEEQRLYLEFLVFAELFRSWGWETQICDYRMVPEQIDFIYNRYTDFFLSDVTSKTLRQRFNDRTVTLSPNPAEYLFLADKTRMIEWYQLKDHPTLHRHLARTQIFEPSKLEELWNQRKNLFLKPRRSFGSKQTYKCAKISRRLFEELSTQDFIAQEYVAAPEKVFETDLGPQSFRYDLRFYAYQGRVQSVVARLYQGQVTNLKTPYGGFACVVFEN